MITSRLCARSTRELTLRLPISSRSGMLSAGGHTVNAFVVPWLTLGYKNSSASSFGYTNLTKCLAVDTSIIGACSDPETHLYWQSAREYSL